MPFQFFQQYYTMISTRSMEKSRKRFNGTMISRERLQCGDRSLLRLDNYPAQQAESSFKYRDRVAIIGDILRTVKETRSGRRKTQIMQSANLNYTQTMKYLGYLMGCGLITASDGETYIITSKGYEFLQLVEIQRLQSLK